jgi:hypothetical protein
VEERPVKSFYRATKRNPPTDKDFITRQERQGDPPPGTSEEVRESWDALSFYDTIEGLERQIRQLPAIGRYICRFDVPEDIGITWKETHPPGHYDLRGNKELLKACFVDCVGYVDDA